MNASASVRWTLGIVFALLVFVAGRTVSAVQLDPFVGEWRAAQPADGVVITLTISEASTLVFPGHRQDGSSSSPLNLRVRNLMANDRVATFTVDLPENEGTLNFEFRTTNGMGTLRVLRVAGEAAPDDIPTWALEKSR